MVSTDTVKTMPKTGTKMRSKKKKEKIKKGNALNSNTYNKKPATLKGLETFAADVKPGHYIITDGLSIAKDWPMNDTNTLAATLLVIGNLNNPSTMQGYRVYLLFTNKKQFFVLTQWWSKEDVKADNWRKIDLNVIN